MDSPWASLLTVLAVPVFLLREGAPVPESSPWSLAGLTVSSCLSYTGAQNRTQFWTHAGKSSYSLDLNLHTLLLFQSSVPWYSFQQVCKVQLLHTFPSEVGVKLSGSWCQQAFTVWFLQCKSISCSVQGALLPISLPPERCQMLHVNFLCASWGKTHINLLLELLGSIMPTVLTSHLHWFKLAQLIFLVIVWLYNQTQQELKAGLKDERFDHSFLPEFLSCS